MCETPKPARRFQFSLRRCLQFRLRTLLIAVLVLSLPLSWFAMRLQKARRQREAVEAIRRLGGAAEYEWKALGRARTAQPEATWLRRLLGDDFFYPIKYVALPESAADRDMEHLTTLTSVDTLDISATNITDTGLKRVRALTGLRIIDLNDTRVTDAGLENLKSLTNLEIVYLCDTDVTDAGLRHLRGLPNLALLYLVGTDVTDVGLENLKSLPELWELALSNTRLTDAGLEHLRGLDRLEALFLNGTRVTSEGVESLQESLPKCDISY